MDEKLQAQIDEARAQGYTEQQIQEYLNPKPVVREDQKKDQTGAPVSPFVNRHEETTGLAQYGAAKAAQLGAELYTGKKLILDPLFRAFGGKGGSAPVSGPVNPSNMPGTSAIMPEGAPGVSPTTLSAGANPAFDAAMARPYGAGPVLSSAVPAAAFSAPYAMAAYEQSKIRGNPNAPGLENNPYAQQYRGEYATQGAAGAANQRQAVAGQQYGGLSQQEQDMLQQDAIDRAIRLKAAKKVLQGPQ